METPRLFITDYASYNEGSQFEFGHWLEIDQFADAQEFFAYITEHFAKCDSISPLDCGGTREELMVTDYENFPHSLYSECMSPQEIQNLIEYINLDHDDKTKLGYLINDGFDFQEALEKYQNQYFIGDGKDEIFEHFEMMDPEAYKAWLNSDFISFDWRHYRERIFNEYTTENGETVFFESFN